MTGTSTTPPIRPLSGITVVDLTLAYAGPFATLLLGGLGANVIKVENPVGGDMARGNPPFISTEDVTFDRFAPGVISIPFINRARNKKSITLNLKEPDGKKLFHQLINRADVFVENFGPGVVERLGIDYESLRAIYPRLIYCGIKGYGLDAPIEGSKAMDIMIQARSGLMGATGWAGEPPVRSGIPIGDLTAPLVAVIGILSALRYRDQTGIGQLVDISMLDVLTALVAGEHYDALSRYGLEIRTGNSLARMSPFGAYPTADGWIAIAAPTDVLTEMLFRCIGKLHLLQDPRFATRNQRTIHVALVDAEIREWTVLRTTNEAILALNEHEVPVTDVKSPQEAVHDPLVLRRKGVVPLVHPVSGPTEMMATGMPIRFSASPCEFDQPAPALGQHNQEIYGDWLGYGEAQLAELKARGVI